MDQMFISEEEKNWLKNSITLTLEICSYSSDFNRPLFDAPLKDCQFQKLEI